MTFRFTSASFLQHFAWLPLRIFGWLFLDLKIYGIENVKKVGNQVIFAGNHASEFDPLMIVACLPFFSPLLPLTFVSRTKDFYTMTPRGFMYGGLFFRLMGAYPAYKGTGDYADALRHHLMRIESGSSVCIYPVGRFHEPTESADARGGVSYLASTTGLPVIPVRITGVSHTYSTLSYLMRKRHMTIHFGSPLHIQAIKSKDRKKRDIYYRKKAKEIMDQIAKL